MRQIIIFTMGFLILLFAFSPDVFAKDYCGFESTPTGQELRVINYVIVADLYCQKYGYGQSYISFGKKTVSHRQQLQAQGERIFKEKMKSSSCLQELGDIGSRGAKGAYDKWVTSSGNYYSSQAINNREEFCNQAISVIDQYMKNGPAADIQIQTIDKISSATQKMRPPVSQTKSSSSSYSGPLMSPPSHSSVYQALLPANFNYATLPAFVFVPGIGYVPTTQIGPVYGTYGGAVKGSQ